MEDLKRRYSHLTILTRIKTLVVMGFRGVFVSINTPAPPPTSGSAEGIIIIAIAIRWRVIKKKKCYERK